MSASPSRSRVSDRSVRPTGGGRTRGSPLLLSFRLRQSLLDVFALFFELFDSGAEVADDVGVAGFLGDLVDRAAGEVAAFFGGAAVGEGPEGGDGLFVAEFAERVQCRDLRAEHGVVDEVEQDGADAVAH